MPSLNHTKIVPDKSVQIYVNIFPEDPQFQELVRSAEKGILQGILPVRIPQGSGGSYFVKDKNERIVGVFKPKDEEPYSELNPKSMKKLHKRCFPCLFRRNCLVPNQGYLCEAAASIVSERLDLGIVPKTKVVRLSSSAFNYRNADFDDKSFTPPLKIGSMQTYVEGFEDAEFWMENFENQTISEGLKKEFQYKFEKMIILDYIIRNTDRGKHSWLVKLQMEGFQSDDESDFLSKSTHVQLVAIDNALSFPYKHPDHVRLYPFNWLRLPEARVPFSEKSKNLVLEKLSRSSFVESLAEELHELFSQDDNFNLNVFEEQMAVMRGQITNLCQALQEKMTGEQLAGMEPVYLVKVGRYSVQSITKSLQKKYRKRKPLLSCC